MWGCNERRFWHGLPDDEQRAALCPDRQKGEKERDGRESHCWRKTRRFFCFRLGENFFFSPPPRRCRVLFGLSCEFSVELHHLLGTRQLGASGAPGSRSVFCQLSVM